MMRIIIRSLHLWLSLGNSLSQFLLARAVCPITIVSLAGRTTRGTIMTAKRNDDCKRRSAADAGLAGLLQKKLPSYVPVKLSAVVGWSNLLRPPLLSNTGTLKKHLPLALISETGEPPGSNAVLWTFFSHLVRCLSTCAWILFLLPAIQEPLKRFSGWRSISGMSGETSYKQYEEGLEHCALSVSLLIPEFSSCFGQAIQEAFYTCWLKLLPLAGLPALILCCSGFLVCS